MSARTAEGPFDESWLAPAPPAELRPAASDPTFSIVIATYEAADTVGGAIESALAQTLAPLEVIVVDDGSRDGIEQALRPFAGQINVVRKRNGGGASALNAGIEAANGDFLAILDADDAYEPRRLEALTALARARPDLDLITTDAVFVVGEAEMGTFATHNPFAIEDQRSVIFDYCFPGGWPATRLARLREIGGFDESLRTGYDWDCWLRLLLGGSAAGIWVEPLYRYVLHPGSLTSSRASSMWDRVRLLEKAAENPDLRPEQRPALRRALRTHRSRAVVAEVQAVLYHGAPRDRLRAAVRARGLERRARLDALLALIAPALARRLVPEDRPAAERLAAAQ